MLVLEARVNIVASLSAVIIAVTENEPRVLTVSVPEGVSPEARRRDAASEQTLTDALPTGPLDPAGDRTLELAVRRWVRSATGLELGYVEQLYTFGDRFRDPREFDGGPRILTVAYLALVRESPPGGELEAQWRGMYRFLPWEDWRVTRPELIDGHIEPALRRWIEGGSATPEGAERRERAAVVFGSGGTQWDGERVLERYELLYELGLVSEAVRDRLRLRAGPGTESEKTWISGREMALDHRRILATALGRIRAKIRYRPVVFELMPETFTLFQLQRAVEALAGIKLHKQNFRRLVEQGGLVEGTGRLEHATGGRPAELFRFRREVVLERPAPGVGLPGARW